MLLYTWAQWGHYLNGFLNVPVVLDIGGHMVCCLFICLCIFMILFADFDSIFYLSAVSKSTLKWFAHLSGVQNTSILFCLFICTPIFFSNFFFQSSYRLLYYQAFHSLSPGLSTIWNTIAQSFHTQSGFDSLSVLAKQTAGAPAAAAELTGLCSTRMGTHTVGCFPACTKEPRHAPAGSRDVSHSSWVLAPFHHTAEGHNGISSCLISSWMPDVGKVVWYRLPMGKISLIF